MDDQPAAEPSVSPSTSPVPPPDMRPDSPNPSQPEPMCPLPRKPARFGRRSPPINVTQLMRLAGGLGLAAALSAADAHTDSLGPDWEELEIYHDFIVFLLYVLQIAWRMEMRLRGLSIISAWRRMAYCVQIVSTVTVAIQMHRRRMLHRRVWVSESTFGTGPKCAG